MLDITKKDKIWDEIIRSKTGMKDVTERLPCMRGQWAGHVTRVSSTRWAKIRSEYGHPEKENE